MFSALAARYSVSPYVSLAARTLVRGQPRSGLLCIVAYVFRAKRLTQTLYLLFLCPYVLMFSALAANLTKHKQ